MPFLLLQISSSPTSKYTTYLFDPDNPKASFRLWYFWVWFVVDFLLNCLNKMHPCFVLTGCACFIWRANFNIFKLWCCRWHFHMFLNKAEVIPCLRGGKDEHFLRQKQSLFVLYYFCQTTDLKVGRWLKTKICVHPTFSSRLKHFYLVWLLNLKHKSIKQQRMSCQVNWDTLQKHFIKEEETW